MKLSARVVELNCLFLLVVALLVALQLFLQHAQQHQVAEREAGVEAALLGDAPDVALPVQNDADGALALQGSEQDVVAGAQEESLVAAPFVPNIRKSYPKRKAPYFRKGKNKKKKAPRNKKNKQQKHAPRGVGEQEDEENGGVHQGGKGGGLKKFVGPHKGGGKTWVKFSGKHGAPKTGGKPSHNRQAKVNRSS